MWLPSDWTHGIQYDSVNVCENVTVEKEVNSTRTVAMPTQRKRIRIPGESAVNEEETIYIHVSPMEWTEIKKNV